METTQVEVPTALLKAAELDIENLSKEATQMLALELLREKKVSLGRAAELCQIPLAAFMEFVAKHGVSPLRNSFEDLEAESKAAEQFGV
jgi:predicted HTH domain antitoxin